MLERDNVYKYLSKFGAAVVNQSRANFINKNASGNGSKSIDYDLDVFKNSFGMSFKMEDYMHYQDKGVSGTERKFNTPYAYNNKKPPARVFDKWTISRGLAPRDASGRFLSRKSLNYALSNYIFKYGIKPSLFFTKAFDKEFNRLPDELIEAYGLDVEQLIKLTLNDTK